MADSLAPAPAKRRLQTNGKNSHDRPGTLAAVVKDSAISANVDWRIPRVPAVREDAKMASGADWVCDLFLPVRNLFCLEIDHWLCRRCRGVFRTISILISEAEVSSVKRYIQEVVAWSTRSAGLRLGRCGMLVAPECTLPAWSPQIVLAPRRRKRARRLRQHRRAWNS
jgi:hypothetical protein